MLVSSVVRTAVVWAAVVHFVASSVVKTAFSLCAFVSDVV